MIAYFETTKIYTKALATLFDNIHLLYTIDGKLSPVKVPILFGHASNTWKTRKVIDDAIERLAGEPVDSNKSPFDIKNIDACRFAKIQNYKTPAISIAFTGEQSNRELFPLNHMNYIVYKDSGGTEICRTKLPRPMKYNFVVQFWTSSQDHFEHVKEQILPYIDNGFTLTVEEFIGETRFKRQIFVTLDSISDWNYQETYDEISNKEQNLNLKLNISIDGWKYYPLVTKYAGTDNIVKSIFFKMSTQELISIRNEIFGFESFNTVTYNKLNDNISMEITKDLTDLDKAELYQTKVVQIIDYYNDESYKNELVSDIYNDYILPPDEIIEGTLLFTEQGELLLTDDNKGIDVE